ncbi:hypothetical protein I601_1385 [Nocardioides dokdonensis FR1436]|uniref:Pyridinium-3,5-bisthiocarboxylic acid mononucleotide nickel insertion protein n=1 Tax=Nocardioides dokdonensis FR1436 TaxID=1300347 RepID=A0A1A9GHV1_9ACTN|nr:nickel pincer cofactor biosynthesis protein LarC [Nocardioides dokdonensis]ANH37824.1 hypothetical protein I601_1385 [Nocardioides dokdonensis FR1436]
MTIWVDASAGASGDMLLGALIGAGVPLALLQDAVDAVSPEPVALRAEQVDRGGLLATRCHVEVADSSTHRTWRDVRDLLVAAGLDEQVRAAALAVFARLAAAEGAVHGHDADDVHLHEVGALDAIADVVGVCAGLAHLRDRVGGPVVVGTVAVGSGRVGAAHGSLPVPVPAVVALLRGAPSYAGPPGAAPAEMCTPTGAALLSTLGDAWGPQPALVLEDVGVGAGGRDPDTHANVVRVLAGPAVDAGPTRPPATDEELVLEANVDDLDPRLWPGVLEALMAAGAADAWLTPVLMKKGRPAHTLSVLVRPEHAAAVRGVVFRETSTIGLREHPVTKRALPREVVEVQVAGAPVRVKVSRHEGRAVTAQPEWEDVAAVARVAGRPARAVLAEARSQAWRLLEEDTAWS